MMFLLYTGMALPVVFVLQAFMVTYLSGGDTEQGRGNLCFLSVPVLQ